MPGCSTSIATAAKVHRSGWSPVPVKPPVGVDGALCLSVPTPSPCRQVGITEFCSAGRGFRAATKQRYVDFIVREVQMDGTVARLRSLPVKPTANDSMTEEPIGDAALSLLVALVGDTDARKMVDMQANAIGIAVAKAAKKAARQAQGRARHELTQASAPAGTVPAVIHPAASAADAGAASAAAGSTAAMAALHAVTDAEMADGLLLPRDDDKAHRKQVHDFIKINLQQLISTTEDTVDGGKCVRVITKMDVASDVGGAGKGGRSGGRGGRKRPRYDARADWPVEAGSNRYLEFTLYKENRDTLNAIATLARAMHLSPNLFTFGGTKDRRAVTTQRVSANRVTGARVAQLMERKLFGDTMVLGDFSYEANPLRLGMLAGNHFTITLRDLDDGEESSAATANGGDGGSAARDYASGSAAASSVVEAALLALRTRGFPNYFGLQRFGANAAAPTHEVGAALLRSDWGEVLRLLLMPKPGDGEDELEARRVFWATQDAAAALRVLPRRSSLERSLLEGLRDHGANNILTAITRLPRSLRSMYVHALQSWVWNHATSERLRRFGCERAVEGDLVLPLGADGAEPAADTSADAPIDASEAVDELAGGAPSGADANADAGPTALPEPHAVTAEEEASGTFSIDHVVLPLPGNKVVMPGNDMAAVYTSLLAQHGLAPDCFRHHVKEISMPGAYRRIVQRPADLTWEFFRYSDPTDPLAQTDLAALRNEPLPQGDATGSMRAVVLSFMLPSSTYATMLLRELTKQSTALTHQKELNLYQAPQLAAGQTTGRSEA
eukprot:scaffold6416_cov113-Isochrysis_galbana.AAC.1